MDYLKSGGQTEDENLKRFISLGSAMTNAEFLVCNDSGYALLTADQRLGGKVVAIPQEITQEVLTGSGLYQGRSSLGGAYISKQFVVGVPVQDGDQTIGMVLAVMNARSVMGMWRSFISLFLMTSAIILLLVFIVTSLTSMRRSSPSGRWCRPHGPTPPGTSTCGCRTPTGAMRSASWRRALTTWRTLWRRRSASAGTSSPTSPMN